ncbi:DUF4142 domain-containing protein [Pseudonocardia bannensis]|uniref:DUF4142 domain-containing protein n=1 Tax=Pseudonocardia bannensis TaxID=630973 RepID=A0A848DML9_9PSEU|nr:DUF4142 domain-containing protein [Pseudonocardia bannensis]NMH93795.1 DUF4142 domain-containing protein [Pseudonocardia bannensis]
MRLRRGRTAVGTALAAIALATLSACSSSDTATDSGIPPSTTSAAPAEGAAAQPGAGQVTDAQRAAFGQAHQGALALVAFGGLGGEQGVGEQVRTLGPELAEHGRALDEQIRALATAQGVALGDQIAAEQQAVLADLQARSGQAFDQAWLQTVLDLQQQAGDAANAVLNDPNASAEAKAAARDALTALDATVAKLRQAAGAAGATTPRSVDAGTGGQAASGDVPVVPPVLAGLGVVLLGAAGWWLRRRAA